MSKLLLLLGPAPAVRSCAVGVLAAGALIVVACGGDDSYSTSPAAVHPGDCLDWKLPRDPLGNFEDAINRVGQRSCTSDHEWVVIASIRSTATDSPDLHPLCRQRASDAGLPALPVLGDWEVIPGVNGPVIRAISVPERYDDSTSPHWTLCLAPP